MKVLVVSHEYAPAHSPRAFRWTAVASALAARGHQVDVVCRVIPGTPREEVRDGVRVHRVAGGPGEALRRRLGVETPTVPAGGNGASSSAVPRAGLRGPAAAAARWVHDRTWKQVYWPDFACPWYLPAARRAEALLAEGGYDRLITVSHPFTGHLVGGRLKARHPSLPWVMDVGDPFAFIQGTPTNNARLYGRLNHRTEGRLLRAASAVSVTTEGTRVRYAEVFPESAAKVSVIPPLLSLPERAAEGGRFLRAAPGRLPLVFVGTLHPRLRTPERLLALFRALLGTPVGPRLELHFVGPLNGCEAAFDPYAELAGGRLFCHGAVERADAAAAMREAAALVNLGNLSGYQLPSKVVEYVATGRPVLNLPGAPDDASVPFFAGYPAALQLDHRGPDGVDVVARVAAWLERGEGADAAAVERCLAPYRPDAVVDAYEALLQCAS
ncbi:MAG TPA: glycosyltransferase [Longimicrobium sp.]|nr:glycosyltransferase [Longimicrobium sp.]